MEKNKNVTEELKILIEDYGFNMNTLQAYLGLSFEQIKMLADGNVDFLPDEQQYRFQLFNKIAFLYYSAVEDKNLKLSAFLGVLISYHGLSEQTIAKMAGVKTSDVAGILADPPARVSEEAKFRIAVTVASLRFFLKECEELNE